MANYDAIIAGAGPAGCSAAAILGQKKRRVLLIDKNDFPRDKVCGDGVTYKAFSALKRLELDNQLKEKSSFRTNGYTLVFRDYTQLVFHKPVEENAQAYIIKRYDFDNILLEKAMSYDSVTFIPNTKVSEILLKNEKPVGIKTHDNQVYLSSIIMDATGVSSILGRKNKDPKSCAIAVRGYYENITDLNNTIEVYFSDDILPGYFWIFPTSPTTANIGGGTFQSIVERKKINIKELLLDFIKNHPIASKKLKNATLQGILKGGKIPLAFGDFSWSRVTDTLMLLGDAGGFVNPITAEGISYAMKTGIYAADVANEAIQNNSINEKTLQKYDELWLEEFKNQYKIGDLYLHGFAPEMAQKYIQSNLTRSLGNIDLQDTAVSYEYLVKLKVLAKAF